MTSRPRAPRVDTPDTNGFFRALFSATRAPSVRISAMKLLGRKTVKAEKTSAPMVKAQKAPVAGGVKSVAPTYDEIAKRSYELYLARGGQAGHEVEDWLEAETALTGR